MGFAGKAEIVRGRLSDIVPFCEGGGRKSRHDACGSMRPEGHTRRQVDWWKASRQACRRLSQMLPGIATSAGRASDQPTSGTEQSAWNVSVDYLQLVLPI